jgi:hypothetical protein
VIEAGRLVRYYLPDLIGASDAAEFDDVVVRLLAVAVDDPINAAERLAHLFGVYPATATWLDHVLADEQLLPPALQGYEVRGVDLPPSVQPVTFQRFACPEGDFAWYRRSIVDEPPTCASHDLVLVPAERPA